MKQLTSAVFTNNKNLEDILVERIRSFDWLKKPELIKTNVDFLEKMTRIKPELLIINCDDVEVDAIEMLKLTRRPPFVIGITNDPAKIHILLDNGFFDFLQPEIDLIHFYKKMNKISHILDSLTAQLPAVAEPSAPYETIFTKKTHKNIIINNKKGKVVIPLDETTFIVNTGKSLRIAKKNGSSQYINQSLKKLLTILPENQFVRVNKDTAINLLFMNEYKSSSITVNKVEFPITRVYAPIVKKAISEMEKLNH